METFTKRNGLRLLLAVLFLAVSLFTACGDDPVEPKGPDNGGSNPTAPSAPDTLALTKLTANSALVQWADNSDNEDGFYLYFAESDTQPAMPTTNVAANQTTYTVTDSNAVTLFVWVESYNSVGESASVSDSVRLKTAPAAPSAVALNGTAGERSASISWTDNASDESGFAIYYSETDSQPASATATAAEDATSYSMTGLTASTTYYVWIEATNAYGNSSAATLSNGLTTAEAGIGSISVDDNAVSDDGATVVITVTDSDIAGTTLDVDVSSEADAAPGITMTLNETGADTGIYEGTLTFSESASGVDTILVSDDGSADGDTVTISYSDVTPDTPEDRIATVDYTHTFYDASLGLSADSVIMGADNVGTTTIDITVTDPDIDADVDVTVTSEADATGITMTLTGASGSATGTLNFSDSASGTNTIYVNDNDIVSVSYTDPRAADRSADLDIGTNFAVAISQDGTLSIPATSTWEGLSAFTVNQGQSISFTLVDPDTVSTDNITVNVASYSDPTGIDVTMVWDEANSEWDGTLTIGGSGLAIAVGDVVSFTYTDANRADGTSGDITETSATLVIAASFAPVALTAEETSEGLVTVTFANPDEPAITNIDSDLQAMHLFFDTDSNAAFQELSYWFATTTTGTPGGNVDARSAGIAYNDTTGLYTITDLALAKGQTYYIWIRAAYAAGIVYGGENLHISAPVEVVTSGEAPVAPTAVSITTTNDNDYTVEWTPAATGGTPDGYRVYASETSNVLGDLIATVDNATNDYTVTGALTATTYYVTVAAYDAATEYESTQAEVTTTGTAVIQKTISAAYGYPDSTSIPAVFDGNTAGGWQGGATNITDQWVILDMGASVGVSTVKIFWEAAKPNSYDIFVSDDTNTWGTAAAQVVGIADGSAAETTIFSSTANGRYIGIYGVEGVGDTFAIQYGLNMWEAQVFGPAD